MKKFARIIGTIVLLFTICFQLPAQKLKYKDIYPMLEQKDYEQAEVYLVKFVESNPDHGSAVLHLGILAQDYLKDCERALIHFTKAMKLIDEKELKKNEKYYNEWNRRNLRTGKYGVNLDDIRRELEDRMTRCRE